MNAAETVIVQPFVFARPAGLIESASPSSTDVTAAPAREVDVAPEPGRNRPPAPASDGTRRLPTSTSPPSFIGGEPNSKPGRESEHEHDVVALVRALVHRRLDLDVGIDDGVDRIGPLAAIAAHRVLDTIAVAAKRV